MNEYRLEKISSAASVFYLLLPIVIFFFGWLKGLIALIFSAIVLLFGFNLYKKISTQYSKKLFTDKTRLFWIISFIFICIWVYFSGIGSFSFQNGDFWGRNPIYRDLCKCDWPVIYDLSLEPDRVQVITGTSKVAFSYYFTWWLPPALMSKLSGNIETVNNLFLFLWAVAGCWLAFYNFNSVIGECRYSSLLIFVFFGGLDVIGYALTMRGFSLIEHLEWWAYTTFQYSSNTTQLYWVFNQNISIWIITALLLQLKDNRFIGGLCALSIAYSPWAALGLIPIAFIGSFHKKKGILSAFNLLNVLIVAVLGISFGLFYISSTGSSGGIETTMSVFNDSAIVFVILYLMFIILECGIYLFLVYKDHGKDVYYYVILLELVLFPLIRIREGNFTMRASIPALFILMVYVTKTIYYSKNEFIKKVLIVTLIIGSFASLNEINRSLYNTIFLNIRDNHEEIYSFGQIRTDNDSLTEIARDQFFVYDYENTPFFKYLSR